MQEKINNIKSLFKTWKEKKYHTEFEKVFIESLADNLPENEVLLAVGFMAGYLMTEEEK